METELMLVMFLQHPWVWSSDYSTESSFRLCYFKNRWQISYKRDKSNIFPKNSMRNSVMSWIPVNVFFSQILLQAILFNTTMTGIFLLLLRLYCSICSSPWIYVGVTNSLEVTSFAFQSDSNISNFILSLSTI